MGLLKNSDFFNEEMQRITLQDAHDVGAGFAEWTARLVAANLRTLAKQEAHFAEMWMLCSKQWARRCFNTQAVDALTRSKLCTAKAEAYIHSAEQIDEAFGRKEAEQAPELVPEEADALPF
jgi:hypothetical protein